MKLSKKNQTDVTALKGKWIAVTFLSWPFLYATNDPIQKPDTQVVLKKNKHVSLQFTCLECPHFGAS